MGVVFIHSMRYQDDSSVNIAIVFRQLINFSVPLFLALSGFFLAEKEILNKKEYFTFLKKRIPRVYLPYAVWSLVFIVINIVTIKNISIGNQLFNFVIFQTKAIFYFVALIIQYYILFPILKRFLSKKLLLTSMVVSLMACLLIFAYQHSTHRTLPLILYAGNALTWILFFVLGMYLRIYKINIKRNTIIALAIGAFGLSVVETYFQIEIIGNIGSAVSAVKVSSFLYSALIIVLLLNYKYSIKTIFYDLGKVSYAIYLLHLLVLKVVVKMFAYFNINYYQIMAEIGIGICTLLLSYLMCIGMRKIAPIFSAKYLGI